VGGLFQIEMIDLTYLHKLQAGYKCEEWDIADFAYDADSGRATLAGMTEDRTSGNDRGVGSSIP
jgi:hypothetical protein